MPRRFSTSSQSVCAVPSSTLPGCRTAPHRYSNCSVRVVLPRPRGQRIPILRISGTARPSPGRLFRADDADAVGAQQHFQAVDFLLNFRTFIHVLDHQAVAGGLENGGGGQDVLVLLNGRLDAAEGFVGDQPQAVGGIDQGVAGDAGGGVIGLAEAAVDDDEGGRPP